MKSRSNLALALLDSDTPPTWAALAAGGFPVR
jgi:hypothetical protein